MSNRLSARPNGLFAQATPVTIRDPYSPAAQREEAERVAASAPLTAEWEPCSPREAAEIRRTIELQREAANRGIRLRGLGVRR